MGLWPIPVTYCCRGCAPTTGYIVTFVIRALGPYNCIYFNLAHLYWLRGLGPLNHVLLMIRCLWHLILCCVWDSGYSSMGLWPILFLYAMGLWPIAITVYGAIGPIPITTVIGAYGPYHMGCVYNYK